VHLILEKLQLRLTPLLLLELRPLVLPSVERLLLNGEICLPIGVWLEEEHLGVWQVAHFGPWEPEPDVAVSFGAKCFTGGEMSKLRMWSCENQIHGLVTARTVFPFLVSEWTSTLLDDGSLEDVERKNAHAAGIVIYAWVNLFTAAFGSQGLDALEEKPLIFSIHGNNEVAFTCAHYMIWDKRGPRGVLIQSKKILQTSFEVRQDREWERQLWRSYNMVCDLYEKRTGPTLELLKQGINGLPERVVTREFEYVPGGNQGIDMTAGDVSIQEDKYMGPLAAVTSEPMLLNPPVLDDPLISEMEQEPESKRYKVNMEAKIQHQRLSTSMVEAEEDALESLLAHLESSMTSQVQAGFPTIAEAEAAMAMAMMSSSTMVDTPELAFTNFLQSSC
jgi:hypothetical protein